MISDDVKAFGHLVRMRRKALKWTQEALASEALNNLDRKGMISRIENGKIPNITRETVKRIAEALSIDVEDIPASLRWSEAVEVVKDTNAVVHELQATAEKLVEMLFPQAQDFKIKEGMLIALARRYAEGSPSDFDAAYAGLERALEVAAEDREKGRILANTDDAVNAVIARVDALNEVGRLDTAAALLANEETRAYAGLIRLYDKGLSQAILTRNVESAVAYELKKLHLEAPEPENAYTYLRNVFIEWFMRGDQKGLNFDAEVAIALMRDMACRFSHDQDKKGACLTNLGAALWALGERENGTERLEEAVAAYRAALEERTRDRVPLEWAMTQMNLGIALDALGKRESGTERLLEAIAAYRAALEERTRDRVPLQWAMTQMNLGITFKALGEWESGVERLVEAVAAYRAALEECTRDRVPLDWARTQMNLGSALLELGQRESGTERLEEAVAAYRAALEERTRDRVPLEWARTQMGLGVALWALGERESGTERLVEAIAAYRAALEERTRDRVPLDWAMTQMNLGIALHALGKRVSSTERLEEAVAAYRAALEECTRDRVPLDWAMTQMNLGNALATLGERESGTERLEEAVAAYNAALEEWNRDRVPLDWANTIGNKASALITLAKRTEDAALAARALDQLVEVETVLSEGGHETWAKNCADEILNAETLLGRLTGDDQPKCNCNA